MSKILNYTKIIYLVNIPLSGVYHSVVNVSNEIKTKKKEFRDLEYAAVSGLVKGITSATLLPLILLGGCFSIFKDHEDENTDS